MSTSEITPKWVIYDPLYLNHKTGFQHPEKPGRVEAIMSALLNAGVTDCAHIRTPRQATEVEIAYCHKPTYYALAVKEIPCSDPEGNSDLSTGDVRICPESLDVALYAAGGVLTAVDLVMSGVARSVFCNVRPPGHHACGDVGMGFCIFNNVAIGARYVQREYGIQRVLIVDWDVHHGNGTQEIFYRDPSVFYFSTHQKNLYPGTGFIEESGGGNVLNVPIAAGEGSGKKVLEAFREKLVPAMEAFRPEFVFISAGFDGHKDDLLGSFDLTDVDFVELTKIINAIAEKYAAGRIVSVLEGGYNLEALKTAVTAHVRTLS